ncbi:MAG: DUF2461 domain-containing protein [Planctomycetaceae bacterium]|nr:DUF2461 domain-containing protein [Planctomycetaceae bacterium]
MPAASYNGFPKETLKFLADLKKNNRREWFQEHKAQYEFAFAESALEFISEMQKPLRKLSPFLEAIPKKMGGSLMRIYRDTRFGKDKTPYKTNIGIQFRHEAGCNVHAPGCYVHIEPKNVFIGVGIWRPEKETLRMIRERIAESPGEWKKIRDQKKFRETFQLSGETLKRPPSSFDKEHPMIDDIKRKDFIAICSLKPKQIESSDFIPEVMKLFKQATPYMRFLCDAIEIPY